MTVAAWIARIDRLVWGPGMLALLMGTGVFLTLRTRFLPWRNLGWALRSVLGRQARSGARGAGDVSPFSALMTTLAATIGEEAVTLEDVYEPYLMQLGFLTRTPRGRCVTAKAYQHLHKPIPGGMTAEPPDMDQLTL